MLKLIDLVGLRARGITWCSPYLRALERAGRFPRRIRLGERRIAWIEHEIDAYLAAKAAARATPDDCKPAPFGANAADT